MAREHVVVLFVDIRSCTQWMTGVASVDVLEDFLRAFYTVVQDQFPTGACKPLGDGAMVVVPYATLPHNSALEVLFQDILSAMALVERRFVALCREVEIAAGHTTRLQLGWGVTRGIVHALPQDYLGMVINEASRLCHLARPSGVIIDREDFPTLPLLAGLPFLLTPAEVQIRGVRALMPVWISQDVVLGSGE